MSNLLAACLCAEWCDTCRDYRVEFEALSREFPHYRFVWVDIEDQAELIDDIDVGNFPTLLVADGDSPLFAGTMLPQIGRLQRLLQTLDAQAEPQVGKLTAEELAAYAALAARLQSRQS